MQHGNSGIKSFRQTVRGRSASAEFRKCLLRFGYGRAPQIALRANDATRLTTAQSCRG
jgi:hypothetical protein